MKFKFPLQKVLEHRKIKENLAQKDFQEALQILNQHQAQLESMEKQKHEAHLRTGNLTSQGGAQGPALVQIHEFLRGQDVLIQKMKQKIQDLEKLVESKREILRQSALDYKIMEKMRENKLEEFKAERNRLEQNEADEQSILRFKAKGS